MVGWNSGWHAVVRKSSRAQPRRLKLADFGACCPSPAVADMACNLEITAGAWWFGGIAALPQVHAQVTVGVGLRKRLGALTLTQHNCLDQEFATGNMMQTVTNDPFSCRWKPCHTLLTRNSPQTKWNRSESIRCCADGSSPKHIYPMYMEIASDKCCIVVRQFLHT